METIKYSVIKNDNQYSWYCDILEKLDFSGDESEELEEEKELLTLLIETYDEQNRLTPKSDPIELLKSLMDDHQLRQQDIANIAGIGKSYASEILNYKKEMSKDVIRTLADYFKVRQEAFNRPYPLKGLNQRSNKVFKAQAETNE